MHSDSGAIERIMVVMGTMKEEVTLVRVLEEVGMLVVTIDYVGQVNIVENIIFILNPHG